MSNPLYVFSCAVALSLSLLACSNGDSGGEGCVPNVDISSESKLSLKVQGIGLDNILRVPDNAKVLEESFKITAILPSGKKVVLPTDEDEEKGEKKTSSLVNFNDMSVTTSETGKEELTFHFTLDEALTAKNNRSTYRMNEQEMLGVVRKEMETTESANPEIKICSVQSVTGEFQYDFGDSKLDRAVEMDFKVQLSPSLLEKLKAN